MTQLQYERLPWLLVLFPDKLPDTVKLMRRLRKEGDSLFYSNLGTGLKFVRLMEMNEQKLLDLQDTVLASLNDLDKQGVLWLFSLAQAWRNTNTHMLLLSSRVSTLEVMTRVTPKS